MLTRNTNYSMEKAKLELDLMAKRSELKLQIMDKEADIKEAEGLYNMIKLMLVVSSTPSEVVFVLLSLIVFALFVAIKVVALLAFMENGSELGDALTLIWDDATAGMFAAIMSFWFGNRAVREYVKGKI